MMAVRPERLTITLRRATMPDLDDIVAIERASFSDPPWSRDSFLALVDSPRAYFTVACASPTEHVIGYVVAWFVADEAEIANLAVAPDRRGRGVGSRLLDAALVEARLAGARVVHLEVRDSNAAARALYGARGFLAVGRRRRYYRDPVEDALLLRRDFEA
jgi:[ribosomal protein S18]-alanine N-acetyltransferase